MGISIIIPTHFRPHTLLPLIDSINNQNFSLEHVEILIVTNLDDPFFEKEDFKKSAKGLSYNVLVSGQLGVNRARNIGIKAASREITLMIDDDCLLHKTDYLERVSKAHQLYPDAIAIGGTYVISKDAAPIDKAYNCIARQWQTPDYYGDYNSCHLVGGNVSYKTEILNSSGEKFNEFIEFGGTEAELHKRLIDKGFIALYLDSLQVLHCTSLTIQNLIHKAFFQAQGHIRYNIDEGFSDVSNKTYHNKKLLLARQLSSSAKEFQSIVEYMQLYDWTYNLTCEHPTFLENQVYTRANKWIKNSFTQPGSANQ